MFIHLPDILWCRHIHHLVSVGQTERSSVAWIIHPKWGYYALKNGNLLSYWYIVKDPHLLPAWCFVEDIYLVATRRSIGSNFPFLPGEILLPARWESAGITQTRQSPPKGPSRRIQIPNRSFPAPALCHMHIPPLGQAARQVDKILLSPWQVKRLIWRAAHCLCVHVVTCPEMSFCIFKAVFSCTPSHARVECSVSVFCKLLRRNQCPYFTNGRIKIEIKFRAKATRARKFNRFFLIWCSNLLVFGSCFELELSNVNQPVN